jgi:hypothetical protein
MINDLIQWVADKIGDQRSYPRKSERFAVTWVVNDAQEKPATGIELSANGLVFQMKEKPPGKQVNVKFTIRNRVITARLQIKRSDKVPAGGMALYRFACAFTGIAADDWDAISRFVNDEPEPESKYLDDLAGVRDKDDDAYRLLPLKVQNRLVESLVRANRLEPPAKDGLPVLRLHFIGSTRESDGTQTHRVNVHSRKRVDDKWYAFDSQFAIDARGNVTELK